MRNKVTNESSLRHRQVEFEGISMHVVEAGAAGKPAVLFVHGWPQSWAAFDQAMLLLEKEAHVLAMELPGIGASGPPSCLKVVELPGEHDVERGRESA